MSFSFAKACFSSSVCAFLQVFLTSSFICEGHGLVLVCLCFLDMLRSVKTTGFFPPVSVLEMLALLCLTGW